MSVNDSAGNWNLEKFFRDQANYAHKEIQQLKGERTRLIEKIASLETKNLDLEDKLGFTMQPFNPSEAPPEILLLAKMNHDLVFLTTDPTATPKRPEVLRYKRINPDDN